jgi:hypothetical protein
MSRLRHLKGRKEDWINFAAVIGIVLGMGVFYFLFLHPYITSKIGETISIGFGTVVILITNTLTRLSLQID